MAGFFDKRLNGGSIGLAFVDGDLIRQTVLPNRFLEKAQSGLLVTVSREQEVDGLAVLVDGAVQVFPLALA